MVDGIEKLSETMFNKGVEHALSLGFMINDVDADQLEKLLSHQYIDHEKFPGVHDLLRRLRIRNV